MTDHFEFFEFRVRIERLFSLLDKGELRHAPNHPSYAVSPEGYVVNLKTTHVLKPMRGGAITSPVLQVWVDGKLIHLARMVAETWLGMQHSRPRLLVVDYIDGDYTNVNASNLRWKTKRYARQGDGFLLDNLSKPI